MEYKNDSPFGRKNTLYDRSAVFSNNTLVIPLSLQEQPVNTEDTLMESVESQAMDIDDDSDDMADDLASAEEIRTFSQHMKSFRETQ
jgi:hypothetical protein